MSKHQLICLSVIELDTNGEVMETYRYPAIAPNVNQVILSRSPLFHRSLLNDEREQQQILTSAAAKNDNHHYHFMFSKYQDMNLYTITVLLDKRKQMNNGDDNSNNKKTTENEKSTRSGSTGGKSVQVTAYSITLCTKDYHPTLYQSCLMQVFAPVYLRSEGASQSLDAVQLLGAYLSVFASGKFKNLFSSAAPQFDKRLTKVGNVALLAKLFCLGSNNSNDQSSMKSDDHDGSESQTNGAAQAGVTSEEHFCRIWTAMLLRRRILVHNDKILELNTIVDAFPSLCWHRATGGSSGSSAAKNKNQSQSLLFNNMIRPFVNLNCGAEVSDLENMGVFVAGVNNTDTLKKSVKYDLFVDVSRRETIVSDHAANDFRLTKIHRDMFAAVRAQLEQAPEQVSAVTANKESSELNETLIRVIAEHTQGVIDKLRTIKESNGGVLDMAVIQSVSKQPDTQRFLYSIALSEGLLDQYSQASSTPQEE